jgi:hypothetical protein
MRFLAAAVLMCSVSAPALAQVSQDTLAEAVDSAIGNNPELMAQMAGVVQKFPNQPMHIMSLDYQTEREEYLKQIGALEIEHTLMMSRSVWHKVRESKVGALEGLKLPGGLPGLQPTGTPLPGRFSWDGPALDSPSRDGLSWDVLAWDRFSLENMTKLSLEGRTGDVSGKAVDEDTVQP